MKTKEKSFQAYAMQTNFIIYTSNELVQTHMGDDNKNFNIFKKIYINIIEVIIFFIIKSKNVNYNIGLKYLFLNGKKIYICN